MNYYQKYLKYKNKYLQLKLQYGGSFSSGCEQQQNIKKFITIDNIRYEILCYKPNLNIYLLQNTTDNTFIVLHNITGLIYKSNLVANNEFTIKYRSNIFNFILDYYYRHSNNVNMKELLKNNVGCIDFGIENLIRHFIFSRSPNNEDFQTGSINYFKTLDRIILKIFFDKYVLNENISFFKDYIDVEIINNDIIKNDIFENIMIIYSPEIIIDKLIKKRDEVFFYLIKIKTLIFNYYRFIARDDFIIELMKTKIDEFINYVKNLVEKNLKETNYPYDTVAVLKGISTSFPIYGKVWVENLRM